MSNHPATCSPYCGVQHCACGRPAAHGTKVCSRCRATPSVCDPNALTGTCRFDHDHDEEQR